ncbi:MAG TPA: YbaB/EbfC family nucleoid-associated protein [Candidatus Avipropionibacterium avicola]|uniref:Nucleoid-associated protein IAA98_02710 n=1 Tax=Candidatus Avipropionibacterium avicola TaxID=2840701 RepID=A0A9D1GW73_9ACTN|nr:YbaB/EbfC family nucleoid-associated protein [Candidatus Avipropionibacterium avicola]
MNALLEQAQAMQAQLQQAQEELAETEVTGTAGGDLVTATMNGSMELLTLDIRPEAVDPDDLEGLSDLVVAAVRDAQHNVQALASSKLGPLAGGGGDALGGMGLPGLGG